MRNPQVARGDWRAYVKLVREATGLRTGRLAEQAGVSPETWWRWETRGQRPKDVEVVARFAAGFALDPQEVMWAAGLAVVQPEKPTRELDPRLRGLNPDDPVVKKIMTEDMPENIREMMLNRYRDNRERDIQRYLEQVEGDVELLSGRREG